ncbi:MAG: hypothetical protein J6Z49_01625 [Kiritimatiellae bacterium]|nr:hypothetical protein [Kiritimatiellia bacterium]
MDNSKQRLVLPRSTMRGYKNAALLRGEGRMLLSLQVVSVVTNQTYRQDAEAQRLWGAGSGK